MNGNVPFCSNCLRGIAGVCDRRRAVGCAEGGSAYLRNRCGIEPGGWWEGKSKARTSANAGILRFAQNDKAVGRGPKKLEGADW